MTVKPEEAAALLRAAHEVLAGRTLAAIVRELNAAGVLTATGRAWTYTALRTALCRPRNAGLVSHGRGDRPGMELVGAAQWPAIIPADLWRATRDVLMDPSRRLQRGNERKWLGSGLYRCGLCPPDLGSTLRVAPYKGAGGRRWLYRCTASAHLTVSQDLADDVVVETVRARLGRPDVTAVLALPADDRAATPLRDERAALLARLANFESDYAAGLIDGRQLATASTTVRGQVDKIERELARLVGGGPLAALQASADPVALFDGAPLDTQRAIVDSLLVMTVKPSGRGKKLGPERIAIEWRS